MATIIKLVNGDTREIDDEHKVVLSDHGVQWREADMAHRIPWNAVVEVMWPYEESTGE
jgi:hypothetical protein